MSKERCESSFIDTEEPHVARLLREYAVAYLDEPTPEQVDELKAGIRTRLRHEGIYELHRRGHLAEDIAFYGDHRVEYVEDVIKLGKMCEYSRRTGNAIIFPWPGDD